MTTAQLDLDLVLPGHPSESDVCLERLQQRLSGTRGIGKAHFKSENGSGTKLCLHYDPDVVGLRELERLARGAGAEVQERFKHDTFSLSGLHCSDCASSIEGVVRRLPGVVDVGANYATEKMRVVYDGRAVDKEQIIREVEGLGYRARGEITHQDEELEVGHHEKKFLGLPSELFLSLLSGAALITAWVGESFLGLPGPLALVLFIGAYVAGGYDASKHAVKAALKGRFDIDSLMVVAALGAAALGEWAEGALLLFLFSLGHSLEHFAMDRARNAIRALGKLAPKTARVRRGGLEEEVPVRQLGIGDMVVVRAGERIPADGSVAEGESSVDQSPITGESMPVEKEPGEQVFAGTINGDGSLVIEMTKRPEDTVLARVVEMVEQAQTAKSPTQRFSERFERIFVPAVLLLTALVIVLPPLLGVQFSESFLRAMTLLVAASPCALALATPSAVLAGIARAARSGVLIKGGVHLENAGMARVVAFDKTGTLTAGKPRVTDLFTVAPDDSEMLAQTAAVESRTTHPLGRAIVGHAEEQGLRLPPVEEFEAVKGMGVKARIGDTELLIGNEKLMETCAVKPDPSVAARKEDLEREGKTVILVARAGRLAGLVAVRDEPREAAKETVANLKQLGIERTVMLTGDNATVAGAIASELGIDEVKAGLLPEEKVEAIRQLKERYGQVIMVGDGVNDAPAMVEASVGVAMGGAGTDVALETADIALMADDLSKLPYALALSRASRRMIVQNLAVSLGVIALLVPSALFGVVGIGIAIVFHEGSTLAVVGNALRLLGYRDRRAKGRGHLPLAPGRATT